MRTYRWWWPLAAGVVVAVVGLVAVVAAAVVGSWALTYHHPGLVDTCLAATDLALTVTFVAAALSLGAVVVWWLWRVAVVVTGLGRGREGSSHRNGCRCPIGSRHGTDHRETT